MTDGALIRVDDRPALRFERRLAYPGERVWRAVTEPAELSRWFLAPADLTAERGMTFEAMGETGEIVEQDPPHRVAWTWGADEFSFELSPGGDGCLLVFTHVFDDRSVGAQHAAGWEAYLDRLEPHLAGGFLSEEEATAALAERHERYAEAFGLDPDVGRRTIAEHHS
jgi:uncharacterized protein YndB with AHSA1/START domain